MASWFATLWTCYIYSDVIVVEPSQRQLCLKLNLDLPTVYMKQNFDQHRIYSEKYHSFPFSRCLFDTYASCMQILWSQGWKYIPCNILSHIHKIKDAFSFYNVHNFWSYSFLNYFGIVSNIYIFSVYFYRCLILIVKMTKRCVN